MNCVNHENKNEHPQTLDLAGGLYNEKIPVTITLVPGDALLVMYLYVDIVFLVRKAHLR